MPSLSMMTLQLMLEQLDEKHTSGHDRLRRDLTEGLNDVNTQLAAVRGDQKADHETLLLQGAGSEGRRELSRTRTVLLAAGIGGGCQILVVLLNHFFDYLQKGTP